MKDDLENAQRKTRKPALGRSLPVRRDAMVVAKRASLSETAQNVRRACRETSPSCWISERSSRRENKCKGRRIVVKRRQIVCNRESGRNGSGMITRFQIL